MLDVRCGLCLLAQNRDSIPSYCTRGRESDVRRLNIYNLLLWDDSLLLLVLNHLLIRHDLLKL